MKYLFLESYSIGEFCQNKKTKMNKLLGLLLLTRVVLSTPNATEVTSPTPVIMPVVIGTKVDPVYYGGLVDLSPPQPQQPPQLPAQLPLPEQPNEEHPSNSQLIQQDSQPQFNSDYQSIAIDVGSTITAVYWQSSSVPESSNLLVIIALALLCVTVFAISLIGFWINRKVLLNRLNKSNKMADDMIAIQLEAGHYRRHEDEPNSIEIGYVPPDYIPSNIIHV